MKDKEYWENYYKNHRSAFAPSGFAEFVLPFIERGGTLIDLGCGNGRDSIFFADNNIRVTGIDQCNGQINYMNSEYGWDNLEFISGDLTDFNGQFDSAYSRFTLHSITDDQQAVLFSNVKKNISGKFFIETRCDKDPIQHNKTDHYRRLINFENLLIVLIAHGFEILYAEISDKFSPYDPKYNSMGNVDSPPIVRVICDCDK